MTEQQKEFIRALLKSYPTSIKVVKQRLSKHGDYRYIPSVKKHQITVNGNLDPTAFFFVLLHEIAHRICYEKYKRTVAPHGPQWKEIFKNLLFEALDRNLFSKDVERNITEFAMNPKSIVKIGSKLHHQLFNLDSEGQNTVLSVLEGTAFQYRKKNYIRMEKRRTRILCKELDSGRVYLFNQHTPIIVLE